MKGNKDIIKQLNKLLEGELTAIDQYFIHSRMYDDWGLNALYERINHEMEDEKGHADILIKRILFLEGKPDLGKRQSLKIGENVPQMLKNDLQLEEKIIINLKDVITLCESNQDYQTRNILIAILADTEEDHTYWLEKQLSLIEKIGLKNYLQSMI